MEIINTLSEFLNENNRRSKKYLIVDGFNIFLRAFIASPAINENGDHVGGYVGFINTIISCIKQFRPTDILIVFDGKGGSSRRKSLLPSYKDGRKSPTNYNRLDIIKNPELEEENKFKQLLKLAEYIDLFPFKFFIQDRVEADDIIAFLAGNGVEKDSNVIILSEDKDYFQLVNERVSVYSPVKKKLYTENIVKEDYGSTQKNFLLYRCFMGDVSDNIPGIKSIGPKNIYELYPFLGSESEDYSVDDIVDYTKEKSLENPKNKRYLNVLEQESKLYLNYELMKLEDTNLSSFQRSAVLDKLRKEDNEFDFVRLREYVERDRIHTVIKDVNSYWIYPIRFFLSEKISK